MARDDREAELHTEADNEPPLTSAEAAAMGLQTERDIRGIPKRMQIVYGEMDGVDTEDQADAHHAEPDEHL